MVTLLDKLTLYVGWPPVKGLMWTFYVMISKSKFIKTSTGRWTTMKQLQVVVRVGLEPKTSRLQVWCPYNHSSMLTKDIHCFRLVHEVIVPMVQFAWSAHLLLSCMTGFIWDLWPPCLLYSTGSLLTSSQRGKEKGKTSVWIKAILLSFRLLFDY